MSPSSVARMVLLKGWPAITVSLPIPSVNLGAVFWGGVGVDVSATVMVNDSAVCSSPSDALTVNSYGDALASSGVVVQLMWPVELIVAVSGAVGSE